MRRDHLPVGRHRRGRCAGADGGRGRRLALGPGRRRRSRRRRRVGRLLRVRANHFRLHRRRLLLRDRLGGLRSPASFPASAPAARRLPASPAAGSARSVPARLPLPRARAARRRPAASPVPARGPSASAAAPTMTGAMSTMIAGRETPGTGRWRVPVHRQRDQRGMRGHDRRRPTLPSAGRRPGRRHHAARTRSRRSAPAVEADQRDLEIAGVAQQVHHLHQVAIADGLVGAQIDALVLLALAWRCRAWRSACRAR